MKNTLLSSPLKSDIDNKSEEFAKYKESMLEKLDVIEDLITEVELGGGQHHHDRLAARGKMPVRERIANFLDPDTPFLEISTLAAYASAYPVGGGCVAGIGIVAGIEVVIFANDPTVLAGAMHAFSGKKWTRAMEISRVNKIPYVQFVESAGGDLRMGGGKGKGASQGTILGAGHFAESGRTFYDVTELSKLRIPTISIVFGSSTAGGAYQPGMSDYNIFIKKQSKVFLGGPPLVKMATGEVSDDETLGGGQMHAEKSGLADYLAEDEMDALRIGREVVSHLNWRKEGSGPTHQADEPINHIEDLLGLVDPRLGSNYNKEEVMTMINVAFLCTDVNAAARPAMSSVVSMLEGKASVQEFETDSRRFGDRSSSRAMMKKLYQHLEENRAPESQTHSLSTAGPWTSSSSAADLYPITITSEYLQNRDSAN